MLKTLAAGLWLELERCAKQPNWAVTLWNVDDNNAVLCPLNESTANSRPTESERAMEGLYTAAVFDRALRPTSLARRLFGVLQGSIFATGKLANYRNTNRQFAVDMHTATSKHSMRHYPTLPVSYRSVSDATGSSRKHLGRD